MAENENRPSRAGQSWWLMGVSALAGSVAGALAMSSPKARRLFTVNDVTAGLTPEYPDLQPQVFPDPPEVILNAAVRVCEDRGWKVVAEDRVDRRLLAEVSATPGFVDDFEVWLVEVEDGTVVHIRSRSRLGRGDLGMNARHIRRFQEALEEAL